MSNEPSRFDTVECESPESLPERMSQKPDSPNPKPRPNPQIKKREFEAESQEARSTQRGSPAESENTLGQEQIEELVLKHIESAVGKGLDGMVGDSSKKSSLAQLVQQRVAAGLDKLVEAEINSRLTTKEIDSMIVASVATRDMVKNVEAVASAVDRDHIDSLVKARINEREVELEKRLDERLQWQLKNHTAEYATPVSMSRPPTSPRPFSSSHQSRPSPQNKAAWTAGTLYTVAMVPNHDTTIPLTHADLEKDLTEKVLATQPDRAALGYNEIIMRDIANSVVRELVGIFESLLDRLLIEKKHDTLRTMVAELVTEDTLKLIATSRDQLKQREMGHITRELEKLGGEARDRDKQWEERFATETRDLKDSQDDLYHHYNERCSKIEERLVVVEQSCLKFAELDASLQVQKKNIEEVRESNATQRGQTDAVCAQLDELKSYAKANYLTRDELERNVEEINGSIETLTTNLKQTEVELRGCLVSNDVYESFKKSIEDRLTTHDSELYSHDTEIKKLDTQLTKFQKYNEDTYCTKMNQQDDVDKIRSAAKETKEMLLQRIDNLEEVKCTKKEVDELRTNVRSNQSEMREAQTKTSSSLDKTTGVLMALEQRVDQQFATKKYVDDTTRSMVDEVIERSDSKEELGRLWKEFASEREDLRQTIRQQQQARKDLNDAIQELQDLRGAAGDLRTRCDTLQESVSQVDGRETSHWDAGQEEWRKQKQCHEDLACLFKTHKEEFMSNREFLFAESEKLRKDSTQCYLDQIDKALMIKESVDCVAMENKKLNDTVRAIRLPPVSN